MNELTDKFKKADENNRLLSAYRPLPPETLKPAQSDLQSDCPEYNPAQSDLQSDCPEYKHLQCVKK